MEKLTPLEEKVYNNGERLIPGVTHDIKELIRHRSSYIFFRKVIELDLKEKKVSTPIRIVDLGCGTGHGCSILSEISGSQIVGVDISKESIEYAKKYYLKKNISYQLVNLEDFISKEPEYDYVVSRGVLEHIPNGLDVAVLPKWRKRLLFDVPYDEPKSNPHHVLVGIREEDFSGFPEAELFYEDLDGVIYDVSNKPYKANMIMCVCSNTELPKLKEYNIQFPVSAWNPSMGIYRGNQHENITWFERDEIIPVVMEKVNKVNVILDIGSGIMPQIYTRPLIHICCDPFKDYIEHLQNKTKDELDRHYLVINAGWKEVVEKFPSNSVDSIFLIDIVEHLEKDEGLKLLKLTEKIARNQIVIFTPLGFLPQEHTNGKDAWGLDGVEWQEHKSGWMPEDFDDSWDIYACESFHTHDNLNRPFGKPFGALYAIKNIDNFGNQSAVLEKQNLQSIIDDVINILNHFDCNISYLDFTSWFIQKYQRLVAVHQNLQNLQEEHQNLQKIYHGLQQAHQNLQQAHQNLQQAHQNLQQEHHGRQQAHQNLRQAHQNLQQNYHGLQQEHQNLQQNYQNLQQSKVMRIARKLRKCSFLMKLVSAWFTILDKAYSCYKNTKTSK